MNWAVLADLAAELGAFGVAALVIIAIVSGRLITRGHHNEVVDGLKDDLKDLHEEMALERARHERDPE